MSDRIPVTISRRAWLHTAAGSLLAAHGLPSFARSANPPELTARGIGDVTTPLFHRVDIGVAPGRMHEPTAGTDGSIWTSPLDGHLWRYDTRTGNVDIFDLEMLTNRPWKGLHLWPIATGDKVYLCTPSLPELWVWDRAQNRVLRHPYPHAEPAVYGGFVVPDQPHVYFYDTQHASVLKWDPDAETGQNFPCPYELSGTLYMSFVDAARGEIWGSTYTANDIVRFDIRRDEWTAHYRCPAAEATPTAGGRVFGNTLYVSDHLHGRIFPLNVETGKWGEPIPVPGFRDWFGYVSGGWLFRDQLYFCHSTWIGGAESLDGEPHHFLGSWSVFDPATQKFSRLDFPTRDGETLKYLMADYCTTYDNELFILAVNRESPGNAMILQSKPPA